MGIVAAIRKGYVQAHTPGKSRVFAAVGMEGTGETDWPAEGTGFEPSVSRQEKWSMPSSSNQTQVGRTRTLGGGAECSLEGRDIELSVSPKVALEPWHVAPCGARP